MGYMHVYTYSIERLFVKAANRLRRMLSNDELHEHSILLLFSGGSAVRLYPYLVDWIKEHPSRSFQRKLAVGQADERFFGGDKGNRPAVAKAMAGKGDRGRNKNINAEVIGKTGLWDVCREKGIACHLISQSESNSAEAGTMEESSSEYNQTISDLWKSASKKIAVLGIGEDGHTAGLLPGYQKQWDVDQLVVGYTHNGQFPQRISLTPKALRSLDYALVVAAGESKRPVLNRLQSLQRSDLSRKGQTFVDLDRFPVGILPEMKEVEIFTDFEER